MSIRLIRSIVESSSLDEYLDTHQLGDALLTESYDHYRISYRGARIDLYYYSTKEGFSKLMNARLHDENIDPEDKYAKLYIESLHKLALEYSSRPKMAFSTSIKFLRIFAEKAAPSKYEEDYNEARNKKYKELMAELSEDEKHDDEILADIIQQSYEVEIPNYSQVCDREFKKCLELGKKIKDEEKVPVAG